MVRGGPFPWPIFGLGVVLAIIGLVDGLGRSHGPVAGPYLRSRLH
jgi:hypothetical protein